MSDARTSPNCPKCGGALESTVDPQTGNRAIRCWRASCLFNFLDQLCHLCGGAVVQARRLDFGKYSVECGNLHRWDC
jgi:hypothetical protein